MESSSPGEYVPGASSSIPRAMGVSSHFSLLTMERFEAAEWSMAVEVIACILCKSADVDVGECGVEVRSR